MSNARSIQEYVGKMAIAYARWRDEELQELAELKQIKKEHVCCDCGESLFLNSARDTVPCSHCSVVIHGDHAFYDDITEFLCRACEQKFKSVPPNCPKCETNLHLEFLGNRDGPPPNIGDYCIHCLNCYCHRCSEEAFARHSPLAGCVCHAGPHWKGEREKNMSKTQ